MYIPNNQVLVLNGGINVGNWDHWALVVDDSGNETLYKNGVD